MFEPRGRLLLSDQAERLAAPTEGADNRRRRADYRRFLGVALGYLPPEERQALELYYFGGLSRCAIGKQLGVGRATVARRLQAADQRLRSLAALAQELGCFDAAPDD